MRCDPKTIVALCLASIASADAFWLHRRPGSALDMQRPDTWLDSLRGRRKHDEDVSDDIFRALQELTTDFTSTASRAKHSLLTPGLYLRSDDTDYVLSMDVPGITRSDLTVKVDRGTLAIHAHRECPILKSTNATDPFCIERHYDATFTLPSDADGDKASARLDAGVVKVFVPKLAKEERATGRLLDVAEETVNRVYGRAYEAADNAKDTVYRAAENAKDTAYRAGENAKDTAYRAGENVKDTAYRAGENVRDSAYYAAENVRGTAAAATDRAKRLASEASATAASVAAGVSATVSSVVASVTDEAGKTVNSVSGKAAKSSASVSESVASASAKAARSAASVASAASASASSAAAAAAATEPPAKKGIYEKVKQAVVGGGSTGEVPVEKGDL